MSYNTDGALFDQVVKSQNKYCRARDVPADESPSRVWTESRHPPAARLVSA